MSTATTTSCHAVALPTAIAGKTQGSPEIAHAQLGLSNTAKMAAGQTTNAILVAPLIIVTVVAGRPVNAGQRATARIAKMITCLAVALSLFLVIVAVKCATAQR